jgi:hypothetical protein
MNTDTTRQQPAMPPEDESADPVGDGWSDAEYARRMSTPVSGPPSGPDRLAPDEREKPVEPDRRQDAPGDGADGVDGDESDKSDSLGDPGR